MDESFPFTSVDGDRKYGATAWAMFYHNIFTTGVVGVAGDEKLRVSESAETGMRVDVHSGAVFVQGRNGIVEETFTLDITPGSSTSNRTDSVVVRLDTMERDIKIVYKQGDTSVRRDEIYWELQLATIQVPRNATSVFNSHITDMRSGTDVCGYSKLRGSLDVKGLEQQYGSMLEQLVSQFESEANTNQSDLEQLLTDQQALFQNWLNNLQNQLDDNQAANLQNQIDELTANNEVIEIEHNLGRYPRVELLYWEYGLGAVPLEETPIGISWDGTAPETIPLKVLHPSSQKMEIKVPIKNIMTNPNVTKTEEGYFLQEGIKSMQVKIF